MSNTAPLFVIKFIELAHTHISAEYALLRADQRDELNVGGEKKILKACEDAGKRGINNNVWRPVWSAAQQWHGAGKGSPEEFAHATLRGAMRVAGVIDTGKMSGQTYFLLTATCLLAEECVEILTSTGDDFTNELVTN